MTTDRRGTAPSLRVVSKQHSGVGLAREVEILGDHPVDADDEEVAETGGLQDLLAVATRRVDARRDPGVGQLADKDNCGLEHGNTRVQTLEEHLLLALAKPGNRVLGAITGGTRRERNSTRGKEISHAVAARLAIDEVSIIVAGEW